MAIKTSTETVTVSARVGKATTAAAGQTTFTTIRAIDGVTVVQQSAEIYPVRGDVVSANTTWSYTDVAI